MKSHARQGQVIDHLTKVSFIELSIEQAEVILIGRRLLKIFYKICTFLKKK